MAHILFATFGSYGDLHPFMAIGLKLRRRGHHVTIATCASYGPKVSAQQLAFHPVRPDISVDASSCDPMNHHAEALDAYEGTAMVYRALSVSVRESYADIMEAAKQADLLVTQPLSFAAVLVAKKLGIRWVSCKMAPSSFLSRYEPPVGPDGRWFENLSLPIRKHVLDHFHRLSREWIKEAMDYQEELNLGSGHPLFEGADSPTLVLALFSKVLAQAQPDWPKQTACTGFPVFDRTSADQDGFASLAPKIEQFLRGGPAPG